MSRHIAITLAVLAATPATAVIPNAIPAGAAVDCIRTDQIPARRVRDDYTIDFFMLGGKAYRNVLPGRCPQLGFEEGFAYETRGGRLCAPTAIQVTSRTGGIPGRLCQLGRFQPVTGLHR